MKKFLLTIALASATLCGSAKSMSELWASMPDSLLPYIDHNHRLEMTEFIGMGLKGDVDNMLNSKSVMDSINANYIGITISESSTMQIRKLPMTGADSVLCVVRTWCAPDSESTVTFYDQQWQRLPYQVNLNDYTRSLISKPDTMSNDDYQKLLSKIDFSLVSARLNAGNDDMEVSLSMPSANKDDADKLKVITKPMLLKWNGKYSN